MFFLYRQNNSGGHHIENDLLAKFVIIEAKNAAYANLFAETNLGMDFDSQHCKCCGQRWERAYNEDGTEYPMIYSWNAVSYMKETLIPGLQMKHPRCLIYYEDGRKQVCQ